MEDKKWYAPLRQFVQDDDGNLLPDRVLIKRLGLAVVALFVGIWIITLPFSCSKTEEAKPTPEQVQQQAQADAEQAEKEKKAQENLGALIGFFIVGALAIFLITMVGCILHYGVQIILSTCMIIITCCVVFCSFLYFLSEKDRREVQRQDPVERLFSPEGPLVPALKELFK